MAMYIQNIVLSFKKKNSIQNDDNLYNYNSNLASGSSRESRFSQSVEMMLSYLLGYFLKMSFITTTAS